MVNIQRCIYIYMGNSVTVSKFGAIILKMFVCFDFTEWHFNHTKNKLVFVNNVFKVNFFTQYK